ncbi:MAG: hypothetical protein EBX26_04825 [Actinobacteria bacterium]|nr:hypothetical protein [Actinomycetota bacterium]
MERGSLWCDWNSSDRRSRFCCLRNCQKTQVWSKELKSTHHHGHDVGERLFLHRHTFIHELAPETKILSALLFVIVVVATPIQNRTVFIRSLVEIPFVLFALLMPFFGTGPKVQFLGLELYEAGIWAGAGIVAKGTIGVITAIILSASTSAREILIGLEKLRVPAPLVSIATFMLRYLNVINDELGRMKIARESRGFEERGLRSWRILAQTVGASNAKTI